MEERGKHPRRIGRAALREVSSDGGDSSKAIDIRAYEGDEPEAMRWELIGPWGFHEPISKLRLFASMIVNASHNTMCVSVKVFEPKFIGSWIKTLKIHAKAGEAFGFKCVNRVI
jgi:hypothetical protein